MADPYILRNSRGEIVASITAGAVDQTSTSLTLHGRGTGEYGLERNQNLIFLLENFSSSESPSNPVIGQLWWKTGDQLYVWQSVGSQTPSWRSVVPPAAALGFNVIAGQGLTGGGFPTTSPLQTLLDIGTGTGITVSANDISVNESEILHDGTFGFSANQHIDHSSITLTAGLGLTGGGNITASRTFTVGAGDGIQVTASGVNTDSSVVTIAGSPANQVIGGVKTFRDQIRATGTGAGTLHFAFAADTDTGMYRPSANVLGFATGGQARVEVKANGVLSVVTPNYQTLLTEDDDIPNKSYVDQAIIGGGVSPTENIIQGASILTGLDADQVYLIHVYGVIPNKGNGTETLDGIRVNSGTSLGAGTLLASTASKSINWPDGEKPTYVSLIVDMQGTYTSCHGQINRSSTGGSNIYASKMIAMQITNN